MESIFTEYETLYKIIETLTNSDRYAVSLSKNILGIGEVTTQEEIKKKAEQLGQFFTILAKKKKEWELEEKEKEKLK